MYEPSHKAGPCVYNPSHKAGAPGVNPSDIKWGSRSKDLCGQVSSQLCPKTATRLRAVTWRLTLSSGEQQACQASAASALVPQTRCPASEDCGHPGSPSRRPLLRSPDPEGSDWTPALRRLRGRTAGEVSVRVSLGSPSWHGGRCLGVRPLLTGVCVGGVLKPRPPPPALVSLGLSSGRNETLTGPGCSQGRLSAGSQVGGSWAARGAGCQGWGPGHRAGRACRPLALGLWSCPSPVGSVKVDQADRLAFGPQLWGVIGDGGSVLALYLRPASGPGWSADVLPAATCLGRGPTQLRAPTPCPGCSVSVDSGLGVRKLPSAALSFTWPAITIVSFQR